MLDLNSGTYTTTPQLATTTNLNLETSSVVDYIKIGNPASLGWTYQYPDADPTILTEN